MVNAGVNEGKSPALSVERAKALLDAHTGETLKGVRDRAILSALLFRGLRRADLCSLKVPARTESGRLVVSRATKSHQSATLRLALRQNNIQHPRQSSSQETPNFSRIRKRVFNDGALKPNSIICQNLYETPHSSAARSCVHFFAFRWRRKLCPNFSNGRGLGMPRE